MHNECKFSLFIGLREHMVRASDPKVLFSFLHYFFVKIADQAYSPKLGFIPISPTKSI